MGIFFRILTRRSPCRNYEKMDEKKDSGPMKICATYVKYNACLLTPLLANIFNTILHTGIVPNDWKDSYITPIPKKGNICDITNYRGIAMQSVIPKLFDMLITDRLYHHLEFAIPSTQHGFVRGKSTVSNLMEQTQIIADALKNGKRIDVIYFDFSKAFDQVDHSKLLSKLSKLSIPLPLLKLIATFIIGRTYTIKVDGINTKSSIQPQSSVPQGSHIGPLLYIIFCHDLPNCVTNTNVSPLLYADDTKFAKIIEDDADRRSLQRAIDNLSCWANTNGLTLNTAKTKHVSFWNNTKVKDEHSYYYLGMERIERVPFIRDLGVIFDEKLTFINHIDNISTRITSMYGAAYRFAKELGNIGILMRIINIYVLPVIEYGSVIWNQNRIGHNKKLERILHMASRATLSAPFDVRHPNYINFNTRMHRLRQLTFEKRRIISSLINIIKIIRGILISPLAATINQCRHVPVRTLRNPLPFDSTKIGAMAAKSPIAISLRNYNTYHHLFDETDSVDTIKKKLRDYFLQNNPEFTDY